MKDQADQKTGELPGIDPSTAQEKPHQGAETPAKRGRGRPKNPDTRTNAQRQKDYRDRKRAEREARCKPGSPLTSKVLDLSGDLARALKDRDGKA